MDLGQENESFELLVWKIAFGVWKNRFFAYGKSVGISFTAWPSKLTPFLNPHVGVEGREWHWLWTCQVSWALGVPRSLDPQLGFFFFFSLKFLLKWNGTWPHFCKARANPRPGSFLIGTRQGLAIRRSGLWAQTPVAQPPSSCVTLGKSSPFLCFVTDTGATRCPALRLSAVRTSVPQHLACDTWALNRSPGKMKSRGRGLEGGLELGWGDSVLGHPGEFLWGLFLCSFL